MKTPTCWREIGLPMRTSLLRHSPEETHSATAPTTRRPHELHRLLNRVNSALHCFCQAPFCVHGSPLVRGTRLTLASLLCLRLQCYACAIPPRNTVLPVPSLNLHFLCRRLPTPCDLRVPPHPP